MRHLMASTVALALLALLPACTGPERRGTAESNVAPASADPRLDWWRDARFGMFIHWGLYAIPAGEWGGKTSYGEWVRDEAKIPVGEYEKLREKFNPVKFDAAAWVRLAKAAGMKYIVITSKHHDGFCLFDSKQTDWDVVSTPFGRDIMKEMAEACRAEGIRICWYHSIMDWHHPDYLPRRPWEKEKRPAEGADFERFNAYLKSQVAELLTNYGEIGVLWFDGQWEGTWNHERGADLYEYVRALQPSIIINNRVDKGGGTFGMTKAGQYKGDFGTPEQEIPPAGYPGVDWETCMTMNDHWGFNRHDKKFKSSEDLIRKLADIASKGGNFLLNVGPTAEGEIPPESVERLRDMARWMEVNGESIHGTSAGPCKKLAWGRSTRRAGADGRTRLYLHIFDWPKDGRLAVEGILNDAVGAYLLADTARSPLPVSREADALVVAVSESAPDPIVSVVVLDIEGAADVSEPPQIAAESDVFVQSLGVTIRTDQRETRVRFTLDGTDPSAQAPATGNGPITIGRTTTVSARAYRAERAVSPIARRTFTRVEPRPPVNANPTERGMNFEYFEGDWDKLPNFDAIKPAATGVATAFDRKPRARDDKFAFLYWGYVSVPRDGAYRFWTNSDDGSQLWIGDRLVVDSDGLHSEKEASGVIALARGLHLMTVTMFEKTGGHQLEVWMAGPGEERKKVEAGDLFRAP